MDKENIFYLFKISQRVEHYNKTRKKAVRYIIEKDLVSNKEACINVMIISALWAAHQLNDFLTDDDLEIFFGLKSFENEPEINIQSVKLSEEHTKLSLRQLQDLAVSTHGLI